MQEKCWQVSYYEGKTSGEGSKPTYWETDALVKPILMPVYTGETDVGPNNV